MGENSTFLVSCDFRWEKLQRKKKCQFQTNIYLSSLVSPARLLLLRARMKLQDRKRCGQLNIFKPAVSTNNMCFYSLWLKVHCPISVHNLFLPHNGWHCSIRLGVIQSQTDRWLLVFNHQGSAVTWNQTALINTCNKKMQRQNTRCRLYELIFTLSPWRNMEDTTL